MPQGQIQSDHHKAIGKDKCFMRNNHFQKFIMAIINNPEDNRSLIVSPLYASKPKTLNKLFSKGPCAAQMQVADESSYRFREDLLHLIYVSRGTNPEG